jgi:predicted dehydrogenase
MSQSRITRRQFIATSAAVSSGVVWSASRAQPLPRRASANEKLNIAVVGCGGRGADDLKGVSTENIVALCDCDFRNAATSFKQYPNAKKYSDWRKMLDAEHNNIDAVVVATPDHNHAIVSIHAMKLGKHVYCEKPLAHSIWEARQMAKAAAENRVATQMGTQGHAFEGTRQAVEVIRSGVLGDVRELHVWTDRPAGWWPQGVDRPKDTPPVPKGLDWDVWLGPAHERPYNPAYVPFKWRGFCDFGTGAIGDMGVHNLDTAFWALNLGVPTMSEVVESGPANHETYPARSILRLHFPARENQPELKLTFYDAGKKPPAELFQGAEFEKITNGSLVIGSKATLYTRTWSGGESKSDWFMLLPQKQFEGYEPPARTLPRPGDHHQEWIAACKGGPMSLSNFGYAAVLTESLLLGNLALRTQKRIEWDAQAMKAKNCPEADPIIRPEFRAGWTL